MSKFDKALVVKKLKNNMWEVMRDFVYTDGDIKVTVKAGFKTDFASVPRIFWIVIPPDGRYSQAAVLHDFLYTRKKFSRKLCDKIFLDAMKTLNVPWWKRRTMWAAVRSFGWIPWKFHE